MLYFDEIDNDGDGNEENFRHYRKIHPHKYCVDGKRLSRSSETLRGQRIIQCDFTRKLLIDAVWVKYYRKKISDSVSCR